MPHETESPVSLEQAPERNLFYALGGRAGCHHLAGAFYARVPQDPILRPLYPPHITNCPQHALAAFLTQFLGGPYDYGDRRWFGSLRAAHQRFAIGPQERAAWLTTMFHAMDDIQIQEPARNALRWAFIQASAYLINQPQKLGDGAALPEVPQETEWQEPEATLFQQDVAFRWNAHQMLEQVIDAIRRQKADQALRLLESSVLQEHFRRERAAWLNPLALLSKSKQPTLFDYVEYQLNRDPALIAERYMGGRTLLHEIAGQGNVRIVAALLRLGADPNAGDGYEQTPLYWVSNAYPYDGVARAAVVVALVQAGADVNARERVKGCSALHMAARRGNVAVAQALLGCGADIEARDKYGDTPLHRAVKCRQAEMVALLLASGADAQAKSKSGQTPRQMARGGRIQQVLQASDSEA
jgi:truncated hemoglobin YjbI